ncbi:hypothetical protein SPBR_02859 [Sporothrix brasiliensis 5110]|uniref:HNH nuclease domain-containing protein n=1 Tax=Sporothrix brasiliensis 5110 TaxID=1398154 RepID=A0A0C2FN34_9PEZI|nr:uncharacterized protein SPBR_02859 [Sporothrix brasiliensis 5110]KIH92443.1 hypothetical protein SPBR_02859 [Sporothrix brasiliensis 5110]
MSSPLHRHQASLEDLLDFSAEPPIFPSDAARDHALHLFTHVLDQLDASQNELLSTPFRRIEMIRSMHRHSQTQPSKDLILQSFFSSIDVDILPTTNEVDMGSVAAKVVAFTDFLFANFFLPSDAVLPGSGHRLKALRRDCLIRDRHRCVVTRKFDRNEARKRYERDGENAEDDDGHILTQDNMQQFANLEVAHILPHSLMTHEGSSDMIQARKNALAILDMFDVGIRHLIEGLNIDRPTNALTLTQEVHNEFGRFKLYFEPLVDAPQHTYRIQSTEPIFSPVAPVVRTLFLSENRTTDAPLPRLLAIHAAVTKVLHMCGAGAYSENILRDTEELVIEEDGTTNLGKLVALRMGGWWNGVVV